MGHNFFLSDILSLLLRSISSGPHATPVSVTVQGFVSSVW